METVAFYSYKGGVGRSLLVANTAQFLALCGRKVAVLDLDLEAPGLHQKLGNPQVFQRAADGSLEGAVDELLRILEGSGKDCSIRERAVEVDLPPGTTGSLTLIPAGPAPSQRYWEALEQLNTTLRSARRNGGLPEAVLELQARIADELQPEFLLVDSRTGITELGGLATSLLADRVVCLTTTAPESVEGTRVVASALRSAPRLASQRPLRVDFLITRVTASRNSSEIARLVKELGGDSVAVLPHDSAISNKERVLAGWVPGDGVAPHDDDDDDGHELFGATLSWIAESFPVHKKDAEAARQRMKAVHGAWRDLTRTSEHVRGGSRGRPAWPVEQLRERIRFGNTKKFRQADIVAYEGPADSSKVKPLMIIEYVDGEDRDAVAQWWLSEASVPVVAIFSPNDRGGNADHRLYSKKAAYDSRSHHSDRWDLPLPHDFAALNDPTDVSVDSLLDAVRRGYSEYLERIIAEWVRSSASGLHGGAPWRPKVARKIQDALASVEDVELAKRVLWAAALGPGHRRMWLGDGDEWLDQQVISELFTPLVWRLPPAASIDLLGGYRHFGPPSGQLVLGSLARKLLGLFYDPDATFRVEGQRMLERAGVDEDADEDRGLYGLTGMFRHTEITFEITDNLPPLATSRREEDHPKRGPRMALPRVVSDRLASRSLVITGLLGDYQSTSGKVVLYDEAIELCADKLSLRPRHVGSVTLIHETIHALTHLGRDLDGRMWRDFHLPAADGPLFEPSPFHEALAQYFTHRHLVELRDAALLHAFEAMSARSTSVYRAWERLRHVAAEDVRSWFMSVRRGAGAAVPVLQVLVDAMREDGA
ncbi:MAG: ParA family protein [Acidobacteriota bacterium]